VLSPEAKINLYRIVQEALNNTHKHANAKTVSVVLDNRDDTIALIIEDDGVGFNPKSKKTRSKELGLIGMHERAALIGGSVEIESASKKGTTVYVRVPAADMK
jgi:signal transduction histidine kinase